MDPGVCSFITKSISLFGIEEVRRRPPKWLSTQLWLTREETFGEDKNKMAPVCMAGCPRPCLRLGLVLLIVLFLVLCSFGGCSLITYDRHMLLNLRFSNSHRHVGPWVTPLWPDSLTSMSCLPLSNLHRKRYRKRGKRSGLRVRLKAYLKAKSTNYPYASWDILRFIPSFRGRPDAKLQSHRWICPAGLQVYPALLVAYLPVRSWITSSRRGIHHNNLSVDEVAMCHRR